jgi:Domain of unknown function (DUF4365)
MMDLSQRKQQFSIAYVHAIATVAGFSLYDIRVDDDSVDLGVASRIASKIPRAPRLELQLKCTSDLIRKKNHISFSLKKKNYDDLRVDDLIVQSLLVVLLVPKNEHDWLHHSETEMAFRHCAYWTSLRGMKEKKNPRKVSIRLPRENVFSADVLRNLMMRAGQREQL